MFTFFPLASLSELVSSLSTCGNKEFSLSNDDAMAFGDDDKEAAAVPVIEGLGLV